MPPFFIEPPFLLPFSATKNFLQVPGKNPLPEEAIRKIAKHQVKVLSKRKNDSF